MFDVFEELAYKADSGLDVEKILKKYDLLDESKYRPIGGFKNNYTTINMQGRSAEAALGERIINSVDALLLRKCKEYDKLDPRSPKAPKSVREAVEKYYPIPNGRLHEVDPNSKRRADKITDMSEIFISVTGYEGGIPTINLLDFGEGQSPNDMADTILSLSNKDSPYKQKINFVQGRFNQGGSGSFKFADYTLIVSRRTPKLLTSEVIAELNSGKKQGDREWIERKERDDEWGWTIVKRFPRVDDYDVYQYLAPNGVIPSFKKDKIKLAPKRRIPYGDQAKLATPFDEEIESGTLFKMFNYKLQSVYTQDAWTILRRVMNSKVFYRIPLPARIYELRKHRIRGKGDATNLCGLLYSLKDNPGVIYQPNDSPIVIIDENIPDIGDVYAECWILNWKNTAAKSEHYFGKMSIAYLVNGQVHFAYPPSEMRSKRINKHNMVGYFFCAVDMTQIPIHIRQNILPPDRQTVDDSPEHRKLQQILFDRIKNNPVFEQIDGQIYESSMGDYSKSDVKIDDKLFKQIAKTHPRFIEYMLGKKIPVTIQGTKPKKISLKKWKGKISPTHYDFVEEKI